MTAAGDLDRRVQFRRSSLVDDGVSKVEVFADHGTPVWASKRDLSDGERWRAAEVQAGVTTRFVVRWSGFAAGLTPKDRLVCEGREYEITGTKEIGRREFVEITTASRTDKAGGVAG
jgi:SPP1 family predicted phage head-tail adaptor